MINLSKKEFELNFKKEFEFIDENSINVKIASIESQIKSKSKLLYLQFFTLFIWIVCATLNIISHNMFPFYCNLLCVVCWSFLSYGTIHQIKSFETEIEEKKSILMKTEKEKEKLATDLKSLDFFGKKE